MVKPNFKKTLLIVEDEEELRTAVKELLKSLDIDVIEASNGLQALSIVQERPVNVILSDVKMPQMDGMQFVGELKKIHPEVPVVFFSGYADKELTIQMLKLGAVDLVEKPARKEDLLKAVQNALNKEDSNIFSKLHHLNLNSTQTKVLEMVLKGLSNKEIAGQISLSEQGVKYHVGNLLKRFESTNRFDLRDKIRTLVGAR